MSFPFTWNKPRYKINAYKYKQKTAAQDAEFY